MNSSEAHSVRFSSAGQPTLQLEGRLHLPAGQGPFPAVVIAHPHPLWGGTMDTPVLVTIAHTLAERGWAALRFNFRGVGGSQGSFDEGCGETDDVSGALDWLTTQERVDAGRLAVVGYSFGACVGGSAAARDERVRAYAAVALPMSEPYRVDLTGFGRPKFFITGARDTISPPELLRQYVGGLPEPKTLHVIPGADHMLLGYEQVVAERVADFLMSLVF
jgi:alpha/beta superfamily hydrolase